jgi:hypothetical protein
LARRFIPAAKDFVMAARKKKAAKAKITPEQRIAEYVDSPMITHRMRRGKLVSATILGNYGVYRTEVSTSKRGRTPQGTCTCPSDYQPCKHVYALRETSEVNPTSFFDFDQWLAELFELPKAKLVDAVARVVARSPQCLNEFGVPGFEDDHEGEKDDDWYD